MSSTFKKHLWLIKTLYDSPKTFDELCSEWNRTSYNTDNSRLAKRTLFNHIHDIGEDFKICIENCRMDNTYFYYINRKKSIQDQYIQNLIYLLDYQLKNINDENKKHALCDIDMSVPLPTHFCEITDAVENHSIISCIIKNDKNDDYKLHVFKPSQLIRADHNWFMVGTDQDGRKAHYNISRIEKMKEIGRVLDEEEQDYNAEQYVLNCINNKSSDIFELHSPNDDTQEFISSIKKAYSFFDNRSIESDNI